MSSEDQALPVSKSNVSFDAAEKTVGNWEIESDRGKRWEGMMPAYGSIVQHAMIFPQWFINLVGHTVTTVGVFWIKTREKATIYPYHTGRLIKRTLNLYSIPFII